MAPFQTVVSTIYLLFKECYLWFYWLVSVSGASPRFQACVTKGIWLDFKIKTKDCVQFSAHCRHPIWVPMHPGRKVLFINKSLFTSLTSHSNFRWDFPAHMTLRVEYAIYAMCSNCALNMLHFMLTKHNCGAGEGMLCCSWQIKSCGSSLQAQTFVLSKLCDIAKTKGQL